MDSSNTISSVENGTVHHPKGVQQPTLILSVVDVPFERNGRQPQTVLRAHYGEKLDECLTRLPQHHAGIARVFNVLEYINCIRDRDRYKLVIQHLLERYRDLEHRTRFIEKGFDKPLSTADFGIIFSQWIQCTQEDPYTDEYATVSTATQLISQSWETGSQTSSLMCLNHGKDQLIGRFGSGMSCSRRADLVL
jgi:hypothetical protein